MKKRVILREACFVCSSPYQIISTISIQKTNKFDADLYIFGTFPDYEILASKIQQQSLFSNVYTIDLKKVGLRGWWAKLKRTVLVNTVIGKFLDKRASYKLFFFSSRSSIKSAMLKTLLSRNPDMRIIVFEDGMGAYSDNNSSLVVSRTRRLVEKMLRWDLVDPQRTTFMAYMPQLVHYGPPFDVCSVEQLPRFKPTEDNQRLLFELFSVPDDGKINEKCIIFDSKRQGTTLLSVDQMALMDQCYEVVARHIDRKEIILKPHPRSTETAPGDYKGYPYQGIPMEVLYSDMPDIHNRILISFVSTAVFTPKIFYDAEPIVICLHHIVNDNRISRNYDGIFEKFHNTYRDKGRVFAPASLEELDLIMRRIAEM